MIIQIKVVIQSHFSTYISHLLSFGKGRMQARAIYFRLFLLKTHHIAVEAAYFYGPCGAASLHLHCEGSLSVCLTHQNYYHDATGTHIAISFVTLLGISFTLNWFHTHSPAIIVPVILTIVLSFFVFWISFYFYKRREAKQINAILKKRNF